MISIKNGTFKIEGSTPEILADISTIIHGISENGLKGIDTKDELKNKITKAVDMGFKSEEEIDNQVDELLKKLWNL